MGEEQLFILSKEAYIIDMIATRFVTDKNDFTFDPKNNPEHQEFADFYWGNLLNNKHVINYDGDTVFISGCTYEKAKFLFGDMVCDIETTKKLLAEMLVEKYSLNMMDSWGLEEMIYFDRNFKTKEDIEKWINDQEELIKSLS